MVKNSKQPQTQRSEKTGQENASKHELDSVQADASNEGFRSTVLNADNAAVPAAAASISSLFAFNPATAQEVGEEDVSGTAENASRASGQVSNDTFDEQTTTADPSARHDAASQAHPAQSSATVIQPPVSRESAPQDAAASAFGSEEVITPVAQAPTGQFTSTAPVPQKQDVFVQSVDEPQSPDDEQDTPAPPPQEENVGISSLSDSDTSDNWVNENAIIGSRVGITAKASDPNATDTVTYSLSDDAGGLFAIDPETGIITVADNLDREAAASHDIVVTATSSDGSTSTQTYTIGVTDIDEFDVSPMMDSDRGANTLAENAVAGNTVGVVASASDADATNSAVTYTVDDARFTVDQDGTVRIADGARFDFETETSIDIVVTATSEDGSTSAQTFTLGVTDIAEDIVLTDGNDVFTDTSATELSIDGGGGYDTIIGSDGDDTIRGGDGFDKLSGGAGDDTIYGDNGKDTIYGGDGNDTIDGGAWDDTIYGEAGDDTILGSGGKDKLFGGEGNDHIDGGAWNDTLDGGAGNDTLLGGGGKDTLSGGDGNDSLDGGDWDDTLTGGAGDDVVDGGAGKDAAVFSGNWSDYTITFDSDTDTYTVVDDRPGSPDGTDTVRNVEKFSFADGDVGSNDVLNTAPSDITIDNSSINENSAGGAIVGTLSVNDGNALDTHTYQITSDPSGMFELVGDQIRVKEGATLDREAMDSLNIDIQVTDEAGASYTETLTIALNDMDEFDVTRVTDSDAGANTLAENAVAGNTVGVVASALDADATNSNITYTVDDARFTVDPDGTVRVADGAKFDFESENGMAIVVTATSEDGSTSTQAFKIAVSDVDEFDVSVVRDTDSAANTLAENAAAGDKVGIVASASDADATNSAVTYTVDDTRFTIDSDGTVRVAKDAAFDFEAEDSIDIVVTATSEDGSTSQNTFTLNVTDISEVISGTAGNDVVTDTGDAGDTLEGLGGNDKLTGDDGDNVLDGGTGADLLDGGAGDDTLMMSDDGNWSGAAAKNVTTGERVTLSNSNKSTDILRGGEGNDTVVGTDGNDALFLHDNLQKFYDGDSGARLESVENFNMGEGNDILDLTSPTYSYEIDVNADGGVGNDTLWTAQGDDTLTGGAGNDSLFGGTGNDTAVYSGNRIDYEITLNGDTFTIKDLRDDSPDGTDTVSAVENFQFADGTIAADRLADEMPDYDERGSAGAQTNWGTSRDDTTYGGADADVLGGDAGADILFGGSGDDQLHGNAGEDQLHAGSGNDVVYGGDGNDSVYGNSGNDSLFGEAGDDTIYGGSGNDTIEGGAGNDAIRAGDGDDRVSGGIGDDTVYLGDGNDTFDTTHGDPDDNDGADFVDGGAGNDNIWGGGSADTIVGGTGNDMLAGERGDDTFIYETGDGSDSVYGGSGGGWTDVIELQGMDGAVNISGNTVSGNGWTMQLDSGSILGQNGESLNLSDDSAGIITFDDGAVMSFTEIEQLDW